MIEFDVSFAFCVDCVKWSEILVRILEFWNVIPTHFDTSDFEIFDAKTRNPIPLVTLIISMIFHFCIQIHCTSTIKPIYICFICYTINFIMRIWDSKLRNGISSIVSIREFLKFEGFKVIAPNQMRCDGFIFFMREIMSMLILWFFSWKKEFLDLRDPIGDERVFRRESRFSLTHSIVDEIWSKYVHLCSNYVIIK